MPNRNYLRGRRFEWQVKKDLEKEGFHVTRASGSHSMYDLIAVRQGHYITHIKFIQCKTGKKPNINKLLLELRDGSAIKQEVINADVVIEVELYVKTTGSSEYNVHNISAE